MCGQSRKLKATCRVRPIISYLNLVLRNGYQWTIRQQPQWRYLIRLLRYAHSGKTLENVSTIQSSPDLAPLFRHLRFENGVPITELMPPTLQPDVALSPFCLLPEPLPEINLWR